MKYSCSLLVQGMILKKKVQFKKKRFKRFISSFISRSFVIFFVACFRFNKTGFKFFGLPVTELIHTNLKCYFTLCKFCIVCDHLIDMSFENFKTFSVLLGFKVSSVLGLKCNRFVMSRRLNLKWKSCEKKSYFERFPKFINI